MWTVGSEPLESPDSEALLRAYWYDIVARYYRHYEDRSIDPREGDAAMEEFPTEDLAAWLVARWNGEPAGCAGLRTHGALTRMFIAPDYRRRGGARLLVRAIEDAARELGMTKLQIDTRDDLVEAQRLYLAEGYEEVEPFNDDQYAERFFEKRL